MAPPSPTLILASASPRRRQLLAEGGYRAEIRPTSVEESTARWLTVRELVLLNAQRKALAAARARLGPPGSDASIIIGADTLVCLDGEALGKPRDRAEAQAMLARMAGREHLVFTGVCLALSGGEPGSEPPREVNFVERSRVTFRPMDAAAIAHYHTLIDPLDKAGAYSAQDHPELIIASVDGSWSNVLGLPMERLGAVLREEFGVFPDPPPPNNEKELSTISASLR